MTHPSQLIATARYRLPGAGTDAIMSELANAMQEFCTSTAVWRCDAVRNILADKDRYNLQLTEAGVVFELITVVVGENVYRPISPDDPDGVVPAGFTGYRADRTCLDTITLYPTPREDKPKALRVSVAMRPNMGTIDMPISLVERHHEALLDGLLYRMFSHIAKPYTNLELSRLHERKWRADITRIRRIVRGANSQASPGWAFPQEAPGRTKRGARSYGGG